jgi:hypothetical protein
MLCTINTDASYSPISKRAAYAFWIVSNNFTIKKSGLFKGLCQKPEEAELKSILNINTDCLNAIHILTFDKKSIKKYKLDWGKYYFKMYLKYTKNKSFKVEFRHVKAHNDTDTSRTWVNDWCDKQAKTELRKTYKKDEKR